jgi:predicted ATPase/DNA-binding winged helix-turn-helix (wHTH) protein/tetratricopeptide (TPR) repeat protein
MHARYRFGPFLLDTVSCTLSRDGQPIVLQPAALKLLQYLLDHRGELLTRERLLGELWDATVVDDALNQMLTRLRRALGDDARAPRYIETLHRRGYRFVAPVQVDDGERVRPSVVPSSPLEDALVGRTEALEALARGDPLLTVVGPGGVGKTRLVQEHLRARPGPAPIWCDLAQVRDAVEIAVMAGHQLGLALTEREPLAQVTSALAARPGQVVVLDNAEHAITAAREAAAAWAGRARVLVASRQRLNLPGEEILALEPLGLPGSDEPGQVERAPAAALFVRRARQVVPGFAIDAETAPHVVRIVRATDGLPLALEIAAARLRLLGLASLAERLSAPLDVLSDLRRDPRHATLRAMIAWSWALLEPREQAAMEQLAVFRGPFTAAEGEVILARTALDTLDTLDSLVDKSLLRSVRGPRADDEVRLDMLLPVRAFAEELLHQAADPGPFDRHATWFCRHGTPEGLGTLDREPAALRRLTERLPDLTAALDHAVRRGLSGPAADLYVAIAHLTRLAGPLALSARWASPVLALRELSDLDRTRVLVAAARSLAEMNELARAELHLCEALKLTRSGAPELASTVEGALARLRLDQSHHLEADVHAASALNSDPSGPWQDSRGDWFSVRGRVALVAGRLEDARHWYGEALAWERHMGNHRAEAVAMANMANIFSCTGALGESLRLVGQALALHRAFGNLHNASATQVHQADLLAADDRALEALEVLDEAIGGLREVGAQRFLAVGLYLRGTLLLRLSRLDEAVDALEEARALAREGGVRRIEAIAEGSLGEILAQQGFEDGFRFIDRAEATLRELGERHHLANVQVARARAAFVAGRLDQGLAWSETARSLAIELQDEGLVEEIDRLQDEQRQARSSR